MISQSSTTAPPAALAGGASLPEETTMTTGTVTPIRRQNPETYTEGLGELIRAYRLYLGLSQRAMAERLNKDRRDYQRIESGKDACPPGLLGIIEALTDRFEAHVDAVIAEAQRQGGIRVEIDADPAYEWERNVAGRAAVVASDDPKIPTISLTTERTK